MDRVDLPMTMTTNGNDVIFIHMGKENKLQQVFFGIDFTQCSVRSTEKLLKVIFYPHQSKITWKTFEKKIECKTCTKIHLSLSIFNTYTFSSLDLYTVTCTRYYLTQELRMYYASNSMRCGSINQFGFWIDINWLISLGVLDIENRGTQDQRRVCFGKEKKNQQTKKFFPTRKVRLKWNFLIETNFVQGWRKIMRQDKLWWSSTWFI